MITPAAKEAVKPLTGKQRDALISLLADEDTAIYQMVRTKINAYGPVVVEWLKPHTLSEDPRLRRRSSEIIEAMNRQAADNEFLSFCLRKSEDLDLERGIWLLARTRYPDINLAAYQALLDSYASDISEHINPHGPAQPILAAVNEFLFEHLAFTGNVANYYDPQNSYLNCVLDRKTGNPISLCLIYMLVGRRLRLPLCGIGMPDHFLCRFRSPAEEYYINAFHKGKLLSKADCVRLLHESSCGFHESYLAPATSRSILLRMCANLHRAYTHLKDADEAQRVQRYLIALGK